MSRPWLAALKVDRRVMLLKYKGALFAGLQGTRGSLEVSQCGDFHVIAALAVGGMGGCELWINTQFCYFKKSKVSPRHCTMVNSDHGLLVVNVRAKGLQCTLVVAHAPIEPKTVADRESNAKWWDSLTGSITVRKNVILLIDANAHVGSEVSVSGAGFVQRITTSIVHPFMMSSELSVCVCLRILRSSTLRGTRGLRTGTHHRSDYIAVPLEWAADTISSAVLEDGASNVGHCPVMLVLECAASSGQGD